MSFDGTMKVNFESLQTTQGLLRDHYNTAHQAIEDLKAQLRGSLGSWTGAAQEAYGAAQAEWDKAFASMAAILDAAQTHVGNAHQTYSENEARIVNSWQ